MSLNIDFTLFYVLVVKLIFLYQLPQDAFLELLWAWEWPILGYKHVTLLDTQTLYSKYSCVLTDTNSVCCTIMTQGDVIYND